MIHRHKTPDVFSQPCAGTAGSIHRTMGILAIRCATGIVGMLLVGFPSSPLTADDSTPQLRWDLPVETTSDQTSLADADSGSEFSFRKNLAGNPFDTDKASSDSFGDFRLLGGNPEAGQSIQRVSLILLSIQAEPGSQLASQPDSKVPTETVDQPPGNVMLLNTPPPSPRRVPAEGQTERPGNRVAARRQADEGRGTQERSGQAQPDEVLRPVPSPTTPGRAADPPQAPATGQTPSPVTTGDTTPEIQVTPPLTAEVVASRRTAMEQRTDLSEEVKLQALKNYQQAIELLSQKADADKRYAEQKNQKETGPALIADVKAQLEQPAIRPEPDFPPDSSVAELDQLRLADEELASEARRGLEEWETKAKIRAERRPQMPALIESTRKSLEEAEKAFRSPAPEGENPVLTQSRQTQQEAMVMLLKSQLEQYRVEQMRYEALNELFPLQRDLLLRNRNAYEKRLESWKAILTEARREETARQAREAREKLQNAHPRLRSLAERNAELVARRRALQEFLTEKSTDLTAISGKLTSVEEQFENVNKKNRVRLTTALGVLLRNQRNQLPDADDYYDIRLEAEEDLVRLQTEQMQLTDERNDLGDIETQVSAVLADQTNLAGTIEQQQVSTDGFASEDLRQMAYELLTDRRKYLDDLLADYSTGLQTLGETDVACRRLESLIQQFEAYIDERVLWIRSASAVGIGFPAKTIETARSFIWHPEWVPLIMFIISDAQESWIEYALLLAVLGVLVGFRRRMKSTIATLGVTAQKQTGSGIPQTLLATLLTIIMASVWSVILWFIGWRLGKCDLDLASAMSDAFQFAARWLWNVNSFRGLCRQNGVAQSFLEWPESIVQSLKRNLLLYIAGALPLAFIVVASDKVDQGTASDSVGRLAFVLYSLLLATILRRLVNPNGSVIGDLLR
ncbi:MAG: hypothetical protein KDA91_19680, partial [Planctomycetaceae bacterium]|nr:hypothetical protein [Planctomycetaceae bacterium]